jgi:hypothetical protein
LVTAWLLPGHAVNAGVSRQRDVMPTVPASADEMDHRADLIVDGLLGHGEE